MIMAMLVVMMMVVVVVRMMFGVGMVVLRMMMLLVSMTVVFPCRMRLIYSAESYNNTRLCLQITLTFTLPHKPQNELY